jgi:xanthine dehydrogenase accessory factor
MQDNDKHFRSNADHRNPLSNVGKELPMKDILTDLDRWCANEEAIALATVVQTWGSSPRRGGAKMALTASGQMCGSVSGGCVEGAVYETGLDVIKTGKPQLLHFGVANETAWEVGLACGGSIDVFVRQLDRDWYAALRSNVNADRASMVVTVIRGPIDLLGHEMIVGEDGTMIGAIDPEIDREVLAVAQDALCYGQSQRHTIAAAEPIEVFLDVIAPSPEIIAVGGVHIAIALTQIAKVMGYRTTVIDPRGAFGTEARFPHVDRLIHAWPDEALTQINLSCLSAVVMLTHDPKLDDPALKIALPSEAFYVGALGSRKTQEERRQRMLAASISETDLAKLHGPIGINLGGQTPEEIALAITAEIVACRNRPLASSTH